MSALCAYPSDAFSLTSFTCDERQSHFSYPSMHGYQGTVPGAYAAWPGSEESQPQRVEPAAKRRCLEKSRPAWPQMWAGSSASSAAGFCLGCAACQQQQQGQGDRRPLQERHQNRLFGEAAVVAAAAAAAAAAWAKNKEMLMSRPCTSAGGTLFRRQLSVDPKKDYSAPLFVDCSVEYDLPRVVRPPPGAQPLLIKANNNNGGGGGGVARYPNSNSSTPWNSTHFDWFAKNEKNGKNVVKSALNHHSQRPSLDQIHLAVAAPAPHLLPVPNNNGSVRSSGACGCPSCLGRYWSPPVAATAAAAAAGLAYQQSTMMPFMAPAMTYVEQQQQQPANNNSSSSSTTTSSTSTRRGGNRKRSSAAALLDPVYPAWMGATGAELVFNSGRMVATQAPWMTSQAPLTFSC